MVTKGSVTISLADYKRLEEQESFLQHKLHRHVKASEELAVFLGFLKRNIPDLQHHIEKFNQQSNYSHITEVNGRLTIIINRETETDKISQQQEHSEVSEDS